jgi:hypothetical protein
LRGSRFTWSGALISLGWYIQVFATGLYAVVPQVIGGGSPETKQFIVQNTSSAEVKSLGIQFTPDNSSLTMPLMVIYESDDFVGVIVKTRVAIPHPTAEGVSFAFAESAVVVRLDRKMIEGYVILLATADRSSP